MQPEPQPEPAASAAAAAAAVQPDWERFLMPADQGSPVGTPAEPEQPAVVSHAEEWEADQLAVSMA